MTEIKVDHCGPLTIKTEYLNGTPVLKTFFGPETVVNRQFWPKFGQAGHKTTYEANEIEIEYSKKTVKEVPYLLNGFYLMQAQKLNWSRSDIDDVAKSSQPDEKFFKIFSSKISTLCGSLDAKYAKVQQEMDAKLSLEFSKEKPVQEISQAELPDKDKKSELAKPVQTVCETAIAPPAIAGKGFRSRLNAKLAENKTIAESKEEKPTSSIAARMKKIKTDKDITEQISTLFVHNVPLHYDENDIRESLNNRFNISRINIVRKITPGSNSTVKTSIGSAFIVCNSYEDAMLCLEALNGHRWGNLIASATFSEQKPN